VEPREIVRHWVACFNSADADAIARCYADDAINHQVVRDPVVGRDAIRDMFANEFAAATRVCEVENLYQDGRWAILEWIDPNGLRGSGFFETRDGKIVFQRGYFNELSFLRLNGLSLPAE
jgi:limonene-1,2-epoxide hydrolase